MVMFDSYFPRLALGLTFLFFLILLPVLYEKHAGYKCFVPALPLFPDFKLETKDPLYYRYLWSGTGKKNTWSCLLSVSEKKRKNEYFF